MHAKRLHWVGNFVHCEEHRTFWKLFLRSRTFPLRGVPKTPEESFRSERNLNFQQGFCYKMYGTSTLEKQTADFKPAFHETNPSSRAVKKGIFSGRVLSRKSKSLNCYKFWGSISFQFKMIAALPVRWTLLTTQKKPHRMSRLANNQQSLVRMDECWMLQSSFWTIFPLMAGRTVWSKTAAWHNTKPTTVHEDT